MDNKKFSLGDLFSIVMKRFWLVLVFAIVGAGATFLLRPGDMVASSATAQVMVSPNQRFDISNGTLSDLTRSQAVLGQAVREYNRSLSDKDDRADYSDLYTNLLVNVGSNSRVVTITADQETAKDSKKLVGLIASRLKKVAEQELPTYKVAIITKATTIDKTVEGFSKKKAIILGAAVGVLVAVAAAFLIEVVQSKRGKQK
ncbi:hypothetical protein [Lacticaseibacillus absianus]|uniref:hypothetical protein n=1 Tax=Lacticaseibacillus absianus TaxID=2729623 RepID=UPI0015C8E874|nr:hypothetical protein [Lacticaseibacillus absianus]